MELSLVPEESINKGGKYKMQIKNKKDISCGRGRLSFIAMKQLCSWLGCATKAVR